MGAIINLLIEGRIYAQIFGLFMIVIMMYAERSNPEKVPLWTLTFLVFPIFGVIAYLMVGQTFYAEHTFKLKGVSDNALKNAQKIDELLLKKDEDKLKTVLEFLMTHEIMTGSQFAACMEGRDIEENTSNTTLFDSYTQENQEN